MNMVTSNLPLQQTGRPRRARLRRATVGGRLLSANLVLRTKVESSRNANFGRLPAPTRDTEKRCSPTISSQTLTS
jgi:hypothetical protein